MMALPLRARSLIWSVHCLAAAVAIWAVFFPHPKLAGQEWELVLLGGLALMAGGRKVQVLGNCKPEQNGSLTLGFVITMAAMLRGGPAGGCIVALLGCLSSCLYPRRQPFPQLLFNLSLTAVQSWLSGITYYYLNGSTLAIGGYFTLAAATCAGLVFYTINSAGVTGIIGLSTGADPVKLWKRTVLETGPTYLAGASVIALTIVVSKGNLGAVLLFGTPIAFLVYQSFAASAALAFEKQLRIDEPQQSETQLKHLYEQSESRARQQKALTHLGLLALSGMTLDEWIQHAVEVVSGTLDVRFVSLLERVPGAHKLRLRAGCGWKDGSVGRTTVSTGVGSLAGYTLLTGSATAVQDLNEETRFRKGALLDSHGITSGLTGLVPRSEGGSWGVLGAYSREKREFTDDDAAFIQGVAHLTALVIDRRRHSELIEKNAHEIEGLNQRLQRAMAETHHRVKNNLQIVSGLIELLVMDSGAAIPARELVRLSQHVRSLGVIHDLLTDQAKSQRGIDSLSTKDALDRLIPLLRSLTGPRPLSYRVDDAVLPIGQGASLAVLLNELVSNAVKHGKGDIDVSLAVVNNQARLEVSDGGPGFPPGFTSELAAHTGLDLVENVSRLDLHGKPLYENRPEGGARVVVTFPLSSEEESLVR